MYESHTVPEFIKTIGIFHAFEVYDINWFSETSCSTFISQLFLEIYKANEGEVTVDEPRALVLSSKFLLILQPEKKQTTAGDYYILTAVIPLNNLKNVYKKILQAGIITIEWFQTKEVIFRTY